MKDIVDIIKHYNADILSMSKPDVIADPQRAIQDAFVNSIKSPGLQEIIRKKIDANANASAVIAITDNTRPTPYKGESGILLPIVEMLLENGFLAEKILILVANGTHKPLSQKELQDMLDPRIFSLGIPIKNHKSRNDSEIAYLGKTQRGSEISVNKDYLNADLKILTGLVESHFMAGVSGGRKVICPGLVSERTTHTFHGTEMMLHPNVRDLILDENPCHDESLEIAKFVGADYTVNVTLDHAYRLTGVFAGDLEAAHRRAYQKVKEYVSIPIQKEYDIVITHGGFVGINHYQTAKAAVVSIPVVKKDGTLILLADNTDSDPVGSTKYRTCLHLLKLLGTEKFKKLLQSPDWQFVPEQWQVQMWMKVFEKIEMENFVYYAPQFSQEDYAWVPGTDGNTFLPKEKQYKVQKENSVHMIQNIIQTKSRQSSSKIHMAFLADGPYGIPVSQK